MIAPRPEAGPAAVPALPLHLGMLSPIEVGAYREHLHPGSWHDGLPRGMGATPVNLLCRELLARGQRLTLFTLDPSVEDEVVLEGERLRICIGPYGRPAGRRPARDFFAAERAWLARAIRRERPDLLHAQWTYEYALAAQASDRPHLVTAHDAALRVLRHELIPYRVAHTLMAWRVLSRARRVVSVSPYVAEHIRRWLGYRGEAAVIPNGMAQPLFDHARPPRPPGRAITYATLLNTWNRLKNGRAALEAFALARRRRPGDRLLMLGSDHGPGGPAEAWARRRGLDAGVEFAGHHPHDAALARLAAEVDVLVHPSREESLGMTLLEAGALSLPCIAGARSGAVAWTLARGEAGLLVDVDSPPALAEAMLRLAGDPALREALGQRARANTLERFHVRVVADAYLRAYAEVAGAGR